MPKRIIYRRQLLQAVEAFLEGTSSSRVRAQRIVQRCSAALDNEAKEATVDRIIWNPFVVRLTDSVFYENEVYLREAREILRGQSLQNLARTGISDDFLPYFTGEETEWYVQLLNMVDFLMTIPFAQIHKATFQDWQKRDTWATMRQVIPEAIQAEVIEEEYQRKKALIEAVSARTPPLVNIGDEKIYHLVLREVTALVTGISVGGPAVYYGYPVPSAPYSGYSLDMSESVRWSKRALEVLSGNGGLFISWRLSKAPKGQHLWKMTKEELKNWLVSMRAH